MPRRLRNIFKKSMSPTPYDAVAIDLTMADLTKRNIISRFQVQTILDEVGRVEKVTTEIIAPGEHNGP